MHLSSLHQLIQRCELTSARDGPLRGQQTKDLRFQASIRTDFGFKIRFKSARSGQANSAVETYGPAEQPSNLLPQHNHPIRAAWMRSGLEGAVAEIFIVTQVGWQRSPHAEPDLRQSRLPSHIFQRRH